MPEETLKDRLAEKIRYHDWYYRMSDDSRKYYEGQRSERQLQALFNAYKQEVGDFEAIVFWNDLVPERHRRPVPKGES